jgi:hypothetical protein
VKLTPQQVQEIRDAHRAGYTAVAIGAAFNVSDQMVGRIVRGVAWKHLPDVPGPTPDHPDLKRRTPSLTNVKLTPEDVQRIRHLRRKGHTLTAIADDYGITATNVWHIVRGRTWRHLPDVPAEPAAIPPTAVPLTVSARLTLRVSTGRGARPRLRKVRRHVSRFVTARVRLRVRATVRARGKVGPAPQAVWNRLSALMNQLAR